jgi:hypothetical protein
MSRVIDAWLSAFLFTQAVEIPIYVALIRREGRRGSPPVERGLAGPVALAFGASAVTHPIVWFVIPQIAYDSYWDMVARAELFAVGVEGLYLYAFQLAGLRRAFGWSLLANASSFGLGLSSRAIFGWP